MSPRGILRQSERDAIFRDELIVTANYDPYRHLQDHQVWPDPKLQGYLHYLNHTAFPDPPTQAAVQREWERRKGLPSRTASAKARYVLLPHWDPQACVEILQDHAAQMGGRIATIDPNGLIDLAQQGGFTLHDHVGDAPTDGYMVSLDKHTEQVQPLESLRPQHIADFVSKNARRLNDPHAYLGGWLDGKNFYLDVSVHRPSLDNAAHDAAMARQLAIYDLGRGRSINTPDALWQSGHPERGTHVGAYNLLSWMGNHNKGFWDDDKELNYYEALPAHEWLQHGLGDKEHWGRDDEDEEYHAHGKHEAAAPAALPGGLQYYSPAPGSSHSGTELWREPKSQENWLVKHAPPGAEFLADGDVATAQIAQKVGLETPPTFKTDLGKGPASAQYMYPGAKDAFAGSAIDPEKVSDSDLMELQKHHALDWLIGNHDGHGRQFIRTKEGQLVGIDKGQAFKYFNQDKLHWNFHPNTHYGEHEPVYNTLYRNMAKGGRVINDPRQGDLGKFMQSLQDIPDNEYADMLRPYAEGAAKAGQLGTVLSKKWYDNFDQPKFTPNDVDGFLSAAVARKNNLINDMGNLYDKAAAHAATGTKIAMAAPDPATLQSMHQQLGTHGAKVYADPQGQWLIKKPPQGAEFMAHLDKATAALQHHVGLEAPETYTLPWKDGSNVTAVQMIPGAKQAWQKAPRLGEVHPQDVLTLQKHQALDWLIGNHDGHVGNFLRTPTGSLVGIDKGQAAKYYGRDRLDYNFHPNFYARPPIYNQLWKDYAHGHGGQMHDPRQGELGEFIHNLQHIPDHDLKAMFRPYAESAAKAGLLANPMDSPQGDIHRERRLGEPTVPPNDPEAFLTAMARRKNSLMRDLGSFYDKNTQERRQNAKPPQTPYWHEPGPNPDTPMYLEGPKFVAFRQGAPMPPPETGGMGLAPLPTSPMSSPPEAPAPADLPQAPPPPPQAPLSTPEPPQAPVNTPEPPQAPAPKPPQAPPPAPKTAPAPEAPQPQKPPTPTESDSAPEPSEPAQQAPQPPATQPKVPETPKFDAPDPIETPKPVATPKPNVQSPAQNSFAQQPAAPTPAATAAQPAKPTIDPSLWAGRPGYDNLLPETAKMRYDLETKYNVGGDVIGGFREDPGYPDEHPAGKALDFMTTDPTRQSEVRQQALSNGADYVISNGKMWYPDGRTEPYTGPNPHTDHVHIHMPGDGSSPSSTPGAGAGGGTGGGGTGGSGGSSSSGGGGGKDRPEHRLPVGLVGPSTYDPASGGKIVGTDPTPVPATGEEGKGGGGGSTTPSAQPGGAGSSAGQPPKVDYDPNGGAEQWRKNVEEGLRRNGLPTSMADQVLHQINTESSGNPNARNDWDSNAAKGQNSGGLLQTIPDTYNSYKLPGAGDNMYDPQDNIDAAIAYAKERYGPTLMDEQGNGLGSGHGY